MLWKMIIDCTLFWGARLPNWGPPAKRRQRPPTFAGTSSSTKIIF